MFRVIEPKDEPILAEWIAADPWHREYAKPSFWMDPPDGCVSFAVDDADGPVVYMRFDSEGTAVRLHAQFVAGSPDRIAAAIELGFDVVKEHVKAKGFRSIIFDSESPTLTRFMKKKFGFKTEMRLWL